MISDPALLSVVQTKCVAICPSNFNWQSRGDVFLQLYTGECHKQFEGECKVAGKAGESDCPMTRIVTRN